jgi:hypothetical protein
LSATICSNSTGKIRFAELPTIAGSSQHIRSGIAAWISRARHRAVGRGKVAGAIGKACAERSEVFRRSGHRGASGESRMAFDCNESNCEILASKKSAKINAREIGCSICWFRNGKRLKKDRQATDGSATIMTFGSQWAGYEKRNQAFDARTPCPTGRALFAYSFSGDIAGFFRPPELWQYF